MSGKPFLRFMMFFGLCLCASMIVYIGPTEVLTKISNAHLPNILIAVFFYLLIVLLGLIRWYAFLLLSKTPVAYKKIANIYMLNTFVSNLTPARSGDAMVPKMLSEAADVPTSKSTAMLIVDRASDLLTLATLFVAASIWLVMQTSIQLPANVSMFAIPTIILIAVGSGFMVFRSKVKILAPVQTFLIETQFELKHYLSAAKLVLVVALSIANWSLHFLKEFFLFSAFLQISLIQLAVCQSISNVFILLSFIPGGVGVNVVTNSVLVQQMGLDWQAAATSGLVGTVLFTSIRFLLSLVFNRHLLR